MSLSVLDRLTSSLDKMLSLIVGFIGRYFIKQALSQMGRFTRTRVNLPKNMKKMNAARGAFKETE